MNLSNVDRAKIGNTVHADAVVNIHANGSTDASVAFPVSGGLNGWVHVALRARRTRPTC